MIKLKQAIISSIHGQPWDESKWKEAAMPECLFDVKYPSQNALDWCQDKDGFNLIGFCYIYDLEKKTMYKLLDSGVQEPIDFIIKGCPISLSRLLQALENLGNYFVSYEVQFSQVKLIPKEKQDKGYSFEFIPLIRDGSPATLQDQSEQTIDILCKLFL